MLYRLVYQPVEQASVLVLLIISVALHFAMTGLGLVFFGSEGWRSPPLLEGSVHMGPVAWTAHTFDVLGVFVILILALWLAFSRTLAGKSGVSGKSGRVGVYLGG